MLSSSGLPTAASDPEEVRALVGFLRPSETVTPGEAPEALLAKLQPNICRQGQWVYPSTHSTPSGLPFTACNYINVASSSQNSCIELSSRRLVSDVTRSVDAHRELLIPVEMTPRQAQLYQTVLARRLEVLSGGHANASLVEANGGLPTLPAPVDPIHRVAQLRVVYGDLRKVCSHPYLLPELEPEPDVSLQGEVDHPQQLRALGAAEAQRSSEPGVAVSGKLQMLSRILSCLAEQGKTALLLSHTAKVEGDGGAHKMHGSFIES